MTVVNVKSNRFKRQNNKRVKWQKDNRSSRGDHKNNSRGTFLKIANFVVFGGIITSIVFYCGWSAETTSFQLDIQQADDSMLLLEEARTDLGGALLDDENILSSEEVIINGNKFLKDSKLNYFSIRDSRNELSLNR